MVTCAASLGGLCGAPSAFTQAEQASSTQLQIEVAGAERPGEACLRPDALRTRIAHYSARNPAAPGLRVVVDVQKLADAAAELRIYRGAALLSRRRFERLPVACEDRRDAVALTVALALEAPADQDPAATSGSSAARNEEPPVASDNSAARSQDTAAISGHEATDARLRPAAKSGKAAPTDGTNTVTLGTLPSSISHSPSGEAGPSLQLDLGARWLLEALPFPVWAGSLGIALPFNKRFSVGLSALASTLGETSFATGRARGRLYGLEALGCGSLPLGPTAVELCAGAAAAACEVSGRDYPMPRSDTSLLWAAALARAALRWPADAKVSLRLFAQGHVNSSRPTLAVERAAQTLKPGWIGVTAGSALVITLP